MAYELDNVAENLSSNWYNAVIHDLDFDPDTFQLMQGCLPLEKDYMMWEMFDSIPPLSDDHYYDPSQHNSLSTNYGAVINNLRPFDQSKLNDFYNKYGATIDDLLKKDDSQSGDINYINNMLKTHSQFEDFKNVALLVNEKNRLNGFRDWIKMNMPVDQASIALEALEDAIYQTVTDAIDKWTTSGGNDAMKVYDGTMKALRLKLKSAPGAKVTMRNMQKLSNASESGTDGRMPETSVAVLKTLLDNSDTIVTTTYQHIVEFTATPLSKLSIDPDLSKCKPWYHFPANKLAYENKNIWKSGSPTWDNMFGQNGSMRRICHSLIVVDGISATITGPLAMDNASMAMDNASMAANLKNAARCGLLNSTPPLLWEQNMTITVQDGPKIPEETSPVKIISLTSPLGNPYVLGVNVIPIESYLNLSNTPQLAAGMKGKL